MNPDEEKDDNPSGAQELTPEEAREKREQFLALARNTIVSADSATQESDSADSALATLILPGG